MMFCCRKPITGTHTRTHTSPGKPHFSLLSAHTYSKHRLEPINQSMASTPPHRPPEGVRLGHVASPPRRHEQHSTNNPTYHPEDHPQVVII
jgi:hypothetical protein